MKTSYMHLSYCKWMYILYVVSFHFNPSGLFPRAEHRGNVQPSSPRHAAETDPTARVWEPNCIPVVVLECQTLSRLFMVISLDLHDHAAGKITFNDAFKDFIPSH